MPVRFIFGPAGDPDMLAIAGMREIPVGKMLRASTLKWIEHRMILSMVGKGKAGAARGVPTTGGIVGSEQECQQRAAVAWHMVGDADRLDGIACADHELAAVGRAPHLDGERIGVIEGREARPQR